MAILKVEKRSMSIKARRLGREGFVTGNIFSREIPESTPVKIERTVAERLLKTCSKGNQIPLGVGGQVFDILTKDVCFNSMKGLVGEIGFQALVGGEKIHPATEVILLNHDKVISGVLQQRIQEASYKTLPDAVIDKVKADAGDMKVDDVIRVGGLDIAKNRNIELATDLDITMATAITVHAVTETADKAAPKTRQTGNVL